MEAENRKGKCINIGVCSKANSQEIQIVTDPFAEMRCTECSLPLEEIKEGKERKRSRFPIKKIVNIGLPIIILGLLIWGIVALFSGKSNQQQTIKTDLLSKIPSVEKTQPMEKRGSQTETTESNKTKNSPETKESKSTAVKKSDPNNLTANSIEEYFQKIADKSIPYEKKENLKKEIISKYFSDENVLVVEMGNNNTEVGHTSIKDYVDVISLQYYKIEILKKDVNSNKKITKLFIKEK